MCGPKFLEHENKGVNFKPIKDVWVDNLCNQILLGGNHDYLISISTIFESEGTKSL